MENFQKPGPEFFHRLRSISLAEVPRLFPIIGNEDIHGYYLDRFEDIPNRYANVPFRKRREFINRTKIDRSTAPGPEGEFSLLDTLSTGTLFDFSGRAEILFLNPSGESSENGFVISQQIGVHPLRWLQLAAQYSLYQTDSYDSRIYLREISLPGTFSISPLYGKGNRFALAVKLKLLKMLENNFYYAVSTPATASLRPITMLNPLSGIIREFGGQFKFSF